MKPFLLTLIFLTSIIFNAAAQVPAYVPTTGLTGYWPLQGNLTNYAQNNYTGSSSSITYVPDRRNNNGAAVSLTTAGTYIQFSNIQMNTAGSFSFNYWLDLKAYGSGDIITDLHPGASCGQYMQIWEWNDSVYVVKCGIVPSRMPIAHKSTFLNQWKMLTLVVNSDSTFVYLDGIMKTKFPYTWASSTDANMIIGNGYNFSEQYNHAANVLMDDIGLWNRALTTCEISRMFTTSLPVAITASPVNKISNISSSAVFSVTASSAAGYSWESNIGIGSTFASLNNSGQYSGANTSTLTVSNLTLANNNQKFRCVVSDSANCASVISGEAVLSVLPTGIGNTSLSGSNMLYQNAPNPVNRITVIRYSIFSMEHDASIVLYDITGRIISKHDIAATGSNTVTIDRGQLTPGIYSYSLVVDGYRVDSKKMVVSQ